MTTYRMLILNTCDFMSSLLYYYFVKVSKRNLNKLQKIRKDTVSIIRNVKGYVKKFSQTFNYKMSRL